MGISHLSKTSWEKLENLLLGKIMLIKEIINCVSVAFRELLGQIGGNWLCLSLVQIITWSVQSDHWIIDNFYTAI